MRRLPSKPRQADTGRCAGTVSAPDIDAAHGPGTGKLSDMASTPYGDEIQVYINDELKRLNINAAATVVEGQNNFDYGVHIRGAIKGEHFILKDAYSTGLSEAVKQQIAAVLDGIQAV